MAFQALGVPKTTPQLRRLDAGKHTELLDGLVLEALADAQGELSYQAGPEQPLVYDIHCTLRHGKLHHPRLPLPLDELSATLHCADGRLQLEELSARSGAVEIRGAASGTLPALADDFEARLSVQHLDLSDKLGDQLPDKLRPVYEMFKLSGPATLQLACARRSGEWIDLSDGTPSHAALRPEDVSMCFSKFPYLLEHLTGVLDYTLSDRHLRVDVAGRAGTQPVLIKGTWQGEGPAALVNFDIQGNGVAIDEALLKALPEGPQKLARSFHATGKADIKAHIRHDRGAGAAEFRNEYHAQIHDATLLWDAFPYPLEQVRGILDIYAKHWEFREFHATHHDGQLEAHGQSTQTRAADGSNVQGIALEITGRELALDDDLRQGLGPMPGLLKAWDNFRPQGRLNFVAAVNHPTGQRLRPRRQGRCAGLRGRAGVFPVTCCTTSVDSSITTTTCLSWRSLRHGTAARS